jgi:hypothetical protein
MRYIFTILFVMFRIISVTFSFATERNEISINIGSMNLNILNQTSSVTCTLVTNLGFDSIYVKVTSIGDSSIIPLAPCFITNIASSDTLEVTEICTLNFITLNQGINTVFLNAYDASDTNINYGNTDIDFYCDSISAYMINLGEYFDDIFYRS